MWTRFLRLRSQRRCNIPARDQNFYVVVIAYELRAEFMSLAPSGFRGREIAGGISNCGDPIIVQRLKWIFEDGLLGKGQRSGCVLVGGSDDSDIGPNPEAEAERNQNQYYACIREVNVLRN